MVPTSHVGLFKLIKIKENLKFSSSIALATFQLLSNYRWLMVIALENTKIPSLEGSLDSPSLKGPLKRNKEAFGD